MIKAALSCLFLYNKVKHLKQYIMKVTFLKSIFMIAVLTGALSLTSCKKETTETTTTTEVGATTGEDTLTTTDVDVDENGAKDTISVTTDTVLVKKP